MRETENAPQTRGAERARTWAGQSGEGSRRDVTRCGPGEASWAGAAGAYRGLGDPSSADEVSGAEAPGGGQGSPRTRVLRGRQRGGTGRDGKWDGELGPWEEGRGGVGAGSRRRPDQDRFLPERRPALDQGADGGRPRAGDGEIARLALLPGWQRGCLWLLLGASPEPGGGGSGRRRTRAGAREGGRREGPGAPVTGWQLRSGRVAAAAAPPPRPAAPLAAAAATAAAGRSFTPDPRSELGPRAERGARPAAATRSGPGARSAPTLSRRRRLGGWQRPGLGALRRRRGGCELGDPRAAPQPLS